MVTIHLFSEPHEFAKLPPLETIVTEVISKSYCACTYPNID